MELQTELRGGNSLFICDRNYQAQFLLRETFSNQNFPCNNGTKKLCTNVRCYELRVLIGSELDKDL